MDIFYILGTQKEGLRLILRWNQHVLPQILKYSSMWRNDHTCRVVISMWIVPRHYIFLICETTFFCWVLWLLPVFFSKQDYSLFACVLSFQHVIMWNHLGHYNFLLGGLTPPPVFLRTWLFIVWLPYFFYLGCRTLQYQYHKVSLYLIG